MTEGPGADFGEAYKELLGEIGRWVKQAAVCFWHDLTRRPMPPDFDKGLTEELEWYVEHHHPVAVKFSYGDGLTVRGCLREGFEVGQPGAESGESVVTTLRQDDEGRFTVKETVVDRDEGAHESERNRPSAGATTASGCVRLAPSKVGRQLALLGLSLNALAGDRNTCQPSWKTWLRAKDGEPIRRCKAEMIVGRLNRLLAERGFPRITLSDLQ